MPNKRRSNTLMKKSTKQNSTKMGLLIFIVAFVLLGGFYLIWRSFAANPNAVKNGRIFLNGSFTANPDGQKPYSLNNLPNDYWSWSASMSKDGTKLYYKLGADNKSVYMADVKAYSSKLQGQPIANIKKITTVPAGYSTLGNQVVVSPDGNWIGTLVDNYNANNGGIWISKTDGTGGKLIPGLTKDPRNTYRFPLAFAWLPDSRNIAYLPYSNSRGTLKFCTISTSGSNNKCSDVSLNTTYETPYPIRYMSIATNGKVAVSAYNYPAGKAAAPTADIYTFNTTGTSVRKLTNQASGEEISDFAWSPDSTKIIYSFYGSRSMYLMNSDGTNKKQIQVEGRGSYNISGWTTAPLAK